MLNLMNILGTRLEFMQPGRTILDLTETGGALVVVMSGGVNFRHLRGKDQVDGRPLLPVVLEPKQYLAVVKSHSLVAIMRRKQA